MTLRPMATTTVGITSLRPSPSVSANIFTTQPQALKFPVSHDSIEIDAALWG